MAAPGPSIQQQQQQQQQPPLPPAPTEEQVALSDAHFQQVDFKFDPQTGLLTSPTHDLSFLNGISRALATLPPQIALPPPPNILPPQRTMAINQAREAGLTAYKKKDYFEALKLFTLALDVAASRPLWESANQGKEEMAVCLANRSATFYAVEDWINSLVDAEAVVKLRKQWLKGHFRKGKALVKLARHDEARDAYILGLQFDPESRDLLDALQEIPSLATVTTTKA